MDKRLFGVSTHLYRPQRLMRDHLLEIAAHGFETVELIAERAHIDFENPSAIAEVQQWIAEAGLTACSVVVAPEEAPDAAVAIVRRISAPIFVVAATTPRETAKTIEKLAPLTMPLGVRLAIESSSMRPIASAVHFVEEAVEEPVGIALDFAAAAREGDLGEAIELVAEHLVLARVPVEARVDWASALTMVQKIGYDGPMIFAGPPAGSSKAFLLQARKARERIERLFTA